MECSVSSWWNCSVSSWQNCSVSSCRNFSFSSWWNCLSVVGGTVLSVVGGTVLSVVGRTVLPVVGGTVLSVVGGTVLSVSSWQNCSVSSWRYLKDWLSGRRRIYVLCSCIGCVQSSVSPSFSHLLLLHVGPDCSSSSTLEFEVFSVSDSHVGDASLEKSCKLALPKDATSHVVCSLTQCSNMHNLPCYDSCQGLVEDATTQYCTCWELAMLTVCM